MPYGPDRLVLLTGASGYVGSRLLERLQQAGWPVRCLARRPLSLEGRVRAGTEIVKGDTLDRGSLDIAFRGVHTACYLVHSMAGDGDFEELDRRAAVNFAEAARAAGVAQIVYLGGLGRDEALSSHLASRQEVGRLLRASGVPTVELRASIVIGSGSASFEIVRALVEQLPVIVAPRWVETLAQPIAIEDVLDSLVGAIELRRPLDGIYEIGGADQVTYAEVMREYARQRGLRRHVFLSPILTPRLSRMLLRALSPAYGRVAGAMVESLRNETIVADPSRRAPFGVTGQGLSAAIERALVSEDRAFAHTRWSRELVPAQQPARWGGTRFGRRRVHSRVVQVEPGPDAAFALIQRIGGATGWYGAQWFWTLRGLIDRLRGGTGLRRGRRDANDLRIGDAVDFWRVEHLEAGRLLRLAAEVKMPGRLWLQFEVDSSGERTVIRQTTVFDPAGYVGLAYWYLLYPIHQNIFGRMLRGIQRALSSPPARRDERANRHPRLLSRPTS